MSAPFAIALTSFAIMTIVVLIAYVRLNPFIVLFGTSLLLALGAGMPSDQVVHSFEAGAGHVLGHVGTVIALGTMLGKMLAESGGADRIAFTISNLAGRARVDWAMMMISLLIGLPVFFEVGFVLMIPLVYVLAKRTETPLLRVAIPMCAALSITHSMIPPHPATLLALSAYHAHTGLTILYGILIGTPLAIIAGPIFGRFAASRVKIHENHPLAAQFIRDDKRKEMPPFSATVATILSPVFLMLLGSIADVLTRPQTPVNTALHFVGSTDIALLTATLLSFYVLGLARGFTRETILKFTNECLGPTAMIILLVGAGGGFGRIMVDSGVSKAITDVALQAHVPLLILAWTLAAVVRVACGSSTVAMSTASSIAGPILLQSHGVSPELMVLVTGCGSVAFGPMNDAGFWQFKEYLGLTVTQTVKTWCVVETIIAALGLCFCLAASLLISS